MKASTLTSVCGVLIALAVTLSHSSGVRAGQSRAEDLEGVCQRVASELQALYSISYYPKDKDYDGGWRAVSVQVTRARAQVRAKPGYYAK